MHQCRQCGDSVADSFRYCPWCSAPQRTKFVEFFAPHPEIAGDAKKGLRVSRYLGTDETPAQFRFSIWAGESADAAISLTTTRRPAWARFSPHPRHTAVRCSISCANRSGSDPQCLTPTVSDTI